MSELDDIRKRLSAIDRPAHDKDIRDLLRIATEQEAELAEAVKRLHMHHDDEHPFDECCPTCAFLARQEAKR